MGSPFRCRLISAARSAGVPYLRILSFSTAFKVIQSRSPRSWLTSYFGSVPRSEAVVKEVFLAKPIFVLGRGGLPPAAIGAFRGKGALPGRCELLVVASKLFLGKLDHDDLRVFA
jgi:hypothetical protein